MEFIQLLVLSLIQGITEFLPISSSGHLILPSALLGWPDQGLAFDLAVHFGSLAAVVGYFYKDILQILKAWFVSFNGPKTDDSVLGWAVIIATIPAGLAGLLLDDWIEANLRSIVVIASTTILFGILLGVADRFSGNKVLVNLPNAVVIGFAQALALIPGTSRSGITMTAALMLGYSRDTAARFSFLLSIPLILAASLFKALDLLDQPSVDWFVLISGALLSAVAAFACIHLFLKSLNKIGFMPFVIYRLFLGVVLFIIYFKVV